MNDNDLDAELNAWIDDHDFDDATDRFDGEPIEVSALDERIVTGMLRKRARLLDERARVCERAQERIDPIVEWRNDRVAGVDRQVERIEQAVEGFARKMIPAMGRRSLPLPTGTLQLTKPGQPSCDVIDEGEFVAWAIDDEHPDRDELLKRDVSVKKAELKKVCQLGPRDDDSSTLDVDVFFAIDADGSKVPGVRFTKPALDRFSVTPPA